jgi:hypothetical protein
MMRQVLAAAILLGTSSAVAAQEMRFFYPASPAAAVETLNDRAYGTLQMDVYRPANAARPLPALIFFNIAIPQRFRPRDLEKDPTFAPIQKRPEFQALFR